MNPQKTYSVIVQKASIPLMGVESIHDFLGALDTQAEAFLLGQSGVNSSDGYAYPREVYESSAVYKVIPDWDDSSKDALVRFDYTRNMIDGAFSFSNVQNVKQVTTYEVEKSRTVSAPKDSLWAGIV